MTSVLFSLPEPAGFEEKFNVVAGELYNSRCEFDNLQRDRDEISNELDEANATIERTHTRLHNRIGQNRRVQAKSQRRSNALRESGVALQRKNADIDILWEKNSRLLKEVKDLHKDLAETLAKLAASHAREAQ